MNINRKQNVGSYEAISLATISIINKAFFTSTSITVQLTGTAAWYMTLISCLVSIGFFFVTYLLIKRFPGKNSQEINEIVLGKFFGKLLNLLLSLFWLFYTASALREFVEMIKIYNLPNTPISFILITFMLVIIIVTYNGLTSLIRVSALCFVTIVTGLASLLLLAIPVYEPSFLTPILGHGIDRTLLIGFLRSSAYSEILTLSYFAKHFKDADHYKKSGLISLVLSGIILSISIMTYIMTFGYTSGGNHLSGLFALSRSIYYNRFIQRVESIFLFIWVLSSLITVASAFYFSINLYSESFKIKNLKPLLIPFFFLTYAICIMPKNMSELISVNLLLIRQYGFLLMFTAPILVLLIALITKKKGVVKNGKKN